MASLASPVCAPSCGVARKTGIEGALRVCGTHGGDGVGLGFGFRPALAPRGRAMRGWLEGWLVGCRSCSRARMLACSLGESVGSGGRVPEGFVGLTGLRLPCSVSACDCVCLGCVCVGRSPLKDRLVTFLSFHNSTLARKAWGLSLTFCSSARPRTSPIVSQFHG